MLELACFEVDVTPPDGTMDFSTGKARLPRRDPLFARGFHWRSEDGEFLLVTLDYCLLSHSCYEELRARLAAAAGLSSKQVAIHCVHLHDAPVVVREVVTVAGEDPEVYYGFWPDIVGRLERAVREAPWREVVSLGSNESRVYGYASNRRVVYQGEVHTRYSRCSDPELCRQPVGVIDPALRSIGFYDKAGQLLASLHFYATHPQTANTGERFSGDAPGRALELLKAAYPVGIHAFLTGCGGDVTAGKYTDKQDLEFNIRHFGEVLAGAMRRNLAAPEMRPAERLLLTQAEFEFPARDFDEADLERRAAGKSIREAWVELAMLAALRFRREHAPEMYRLTLLNFDGLRILLAGGELFVAYQLYAQSLIPDEFLAMAANCRDDFYYLPTVEALCNGGGYEVNYFCRVMPRFESEFQQAVNRLLNPQE